ncbi:hypothetical protein K1W54_27325 [Micromonospora sp. CPCC 205371]|nr:hypothetical protein [Micromonospora sp. CPCC 205371]
MNDRTGERDTRRAPGMGTGLVVGCLVGVLGMCGLGAVGLYLLASKAGLIADGDGGLGELAGLAVVLLLVAAGHVGASVWAWRIRPKLVAVALTQAPHVAAYAAVPFWWSATWPVWFILWAAAALAAAGWLTVWFLTVPTVARRAVVYLTAMAVLLAVNIGGIFATGWDRTNGFGWKGQPTPWAAFIALTATSCLADHGFHNNGSRVVEADCALTADRDYTGYYDKPRFDNQLADEQPREAFQKWWGWNRDYQLSFRLSWDQHTTTVDGKQIPFPLPDEISGTTATIEYVLTIESALHAGPDEPYTMTADTITETWHVQFKTVAIGGWKVARIDIPDPIRAAFREN